MPLINKLNLPIRTSCFTARSLLCVRIVCIINRTSDHDCTMTWVVHQTFPDAPQVHSAFIFLAPLDPDDQGTASLHSEIFTKVHGVTSQKA